MTLKLLMQHLHRLAAAVEITRMKFSNIAAIFAPTLLQSPLGDSENLRDVMMQMRCVDMLLKLDEDVWEDVAAIAMSADNRTSSSPLPGRKAGGASPKRESASKLKVGKMDEWQLAHEREKKTRPASEPIGLGSPQGTDAGAGDGSQLAKERPASGGEYGKPSGLFQSTRKTNPLYQSMALDEDAPEANMFSGPSGVTIGEEDEVGEDDGFGGGGGEEGENDDDEEEEEFDEFDSLNPDEVLPADSDEAHNLESGFEMFRLDSDVLKTLTLNMNSRERSKPRGGVRRTGSQIERDGAAAAEEEVGILSL